MNLQLCLKFKDLLKDIDGLFVFQYLNIAYTLKHGGLAIEKSNQKLKRRVVQLIVLVKQEIEKDADVNLSYFLFEPLHRSNCVKELDVVLLVCVGS